MYNYCEEFITPEELSYALNCGMNAVYKLLNSEKIRAIRIGRIWKIPKFAVQEYIDNEWFNRMAAFNNSK